MLPYDGEPILKRRKDAGIIVWNVLAHFVPLSN
ncbi:hypothetical protein BROSI_A2958 [Candidatus Brocadia sinica JPN1]|uniref:Uncharacterized protein n=1 Tax=Candidatus Brocadia sinica JPN1 TaxID=1197129 RepID=A0ABQ0K122_9BACT|nr:hypothetical protein BROSI_A2958 [Candidatus Brocadia sinica JPN1]